ncbi:hypothetical protein E2C01_082232 [Portunus trituberculatus]|uniref:Uncharacterized protein n=1 Tax=Portunus trituberculatus TaxID=210409 RepID=A0A5B7IPD1_PORTR|nr:hypothetical protein [Portunus trituberculatus]
MLVQYQIHHPYHHQGSRTLPSPRQSKHHNTKYDHHHTTKHPQHQTHHH